MIIRYRETFEYEFKQKNRDKFGQAFELVRSTISKYPSNHIPII